MCIVKVGVYVPVGNHAARAPALAGCPGVRDAGGGARPRRAVGADHTLFRFPGAPERGAHDAWSVLAALAAATSTIPIGTLVLGLRFRNPALLAKMAATTDEISGGRLTLGVGAGWHDPEYEAFGYPLDHRLGRTEEAFELLVRLIREGRASMDGRWVHAADAAILPPARSDMRILSSARGGRMVGIVARFADATNIAWVARPSDPVLLERMAGLDRSVRAHRSRPRDPRADGGCQRELSRRDRARGEPRPDQARRRGSRLARGGRGCPACLRGCGLSGDRWSGWSPWTWARWNASRRRWSCCAAEVRGQARGDPAAGSSRLRHCADWLYAMAGRECLVAHGNALPTLAPEPRPVVQTTSRSMSAVPAAGRPAVEIDQSSSFDGWRPAVAQPASREVCVSAPPRGVGRATPASRRPRRWRPDGPARTRCRARAPCPGWTAGAGPSSRWRSSRRDPGR